MIPKINTQEQVEVFLKSHPQSATLAPKPKKRASPKKWLPEFELLSIGTPQIREEKDAKKLLKIQFHYKDTAKNKVHSSVVYFGDRDDFIFTGDKESRVKKILKLKDKDNPFCGDYWRAHLTLRCPTLAEALTKFNQYFILKSNEALQKKTKPLQIK